MMKFNQAAKSLTMEYVEKDGWITSEFSTSIQNIQKKLKELIELDLMLKPFNARWVVYDCEVCRKHDRNRPIHCIIEKQNEFLDHENMKFYKT